ARDLVVLVADDARVQDARGRRQRIDRRIEALLGNRALERDRRVEVGKGGGRRGIGVVVGRYVDRLERGDRALLGRGNPLLELAHLQERITSTKKGSITS